MGLLAGPSRPGVDWPPTPCTHPPRAWSAALWPNQTSDGDQDGDAPSPPLQQTGTGGTRHWGASTGGRGEGDPSPSLHLSSTASHPLVLVLCPGDSHQQCPQLSEPKLLAPSSNFQVLTHDSKAQTSSRPESTAPPPPSTLPRHTLTQDNRTRPPLDLSTSPAPSLPYTPPVPSTSRPPAPGHEHLVLTDSSRERAVSTPSPPRLPVPIPPPNLQSPYLPPFPSPGLPLATHNDL